MPSLGTLSTRLTLDNSGLEQGAKQSESTLGRLRGRLGGVAKAGAAMGVALGAAGIALATALTKQGLAAVDTQTKLARSLGATADGVRAVQIAASDAGIDGLEQSLNALNRRLGAVEMEGGPALETMDRLGLSASELANMDADERLASIADAIKDSGMSAQESARHLQQLGFTQAEANEFFRQGGDAIRNARGEVDEYGLSLSEVDAAKVEAANDAFSRIGRVIEVIRQRLAVQLAPFIEYIADLINDASRESGGWREQIDNAITTGIRLGARLADVIEVIRRAFIVVGHAASVAGVAIARDMLEAANVIMTGPVEAINALIRTANRVPGVNIEQLAPPDVVSRNQARIEGMEQTISASAERIREAFSEPLPSSGLEERLAEIRERSRQAAEQVVADRERMIAPVEGELDGSDSEIDQAHREQLERRLERMRENLMAEQELIEHRHAQALEELRSFREAELLTNEQFAEMAQDLEAQKQEALNRLVEDGEKERHDTIGRFARANQAIRENQMRAETSELRQGLQTMFGDSKEAAIAIGGLKRLESIMSAYSWGASFGGPPAGAAAAAAAGLAQLRTLSQMQSSSSSGGASSYTPSASDSGVSPGGQQGGGQQQPTQIANFSLVGDVFGREQVIGLIDQINDAVGDGVVLRGS